MLELEKWFSSCVSIYILSTEPQAQQWQKKPGVTWWQTSVIPVTERQAWEDPLDLLAGLFNNLASSKSSGFTEPCLKKISVEHLRKKQNVKHWPPHLYTHSRMHTHMLTPPSPPPLQTTTTTKLTRIKEIYFLSEWQKKKLNFVMLKAFHVQWRNSLTKAIWWRKYLWWLLTPRHSIWWWWGQVAGTWSACSHGIHHQESGANASMLSQAPFFMPTVYPHCKGLPRVQHHNIISHMHWEAHLPGDWRLCLLENWR